MHKTLTSVVALAGLAAAAGVAQAEDAVVGGDTMELSLSQMDEVTAAGRVCVVCANVAVVTQNAAALAYAIQYNAAFSENEAEAEAENNSDIDQDIN
jgi:hypothetical protein